VKVTIRAYDQRDAGETADVFYRSDREVAVSDYTVAQVKAWVPGRLDPVRAHRRSSDGRLVLVAADEDDHAVAFIDLEADGHIGRLFCAPEAAGRGVASQLYDAVDAPAREQNIVRLYTEASELARRFFERKGFTVKERQDKTLRGVDITTIQCSRTLPLLLVIRNCPETATSVPECNCARSGGRSWPADLRGHGRHFNRTGRSLKLLAEAAITSTGWSEAVGVVVSATKSTAAPWY
jgi:putative acetyltransferase